jgi:hypothetical protein
MKLSDLAVKLEAMDLRQQEMDKTQAVYREHVSGMLEKILKQTELANSKTSKNVLDIENNRKEQEKSVALLQKEINSRIGPIEVWKARVGGVVVASLVAGSILGTIVTLAFSFIFKH